MIHSGCVLAAHHSRTPVIWPILEPATSQKRCLDLFCSFFSRTCQPASMHVSRLPCMLPLPWPSAVISGTKTAGMRLDSTGLGCCQRTAPILVLP